MSKSKSILTPPPARPVRPRGVPARGFAFDLDRTLVAPGRAPSRLARATIEEARAMGLSAILVSGREYPSLSEYARALGPLDGMVAENGAVIEAPVGGLRQVIGASVACQVRRRLATLPDSQIEYGEIVASAAWTDRHDIQRSLSGLDIEITRNRDRLMVLPAGVTKGTGLKSALHHLRVQEHAFAAIGDAENDLPMLRSAALSGAVANAIPSVKSAADYVAHEPFERGVQEFLQGPVARWMAERPALRLSAPRS